MKSRCVPRYHGEAPCTSAAIHLVFIGTGFGEKQAADKLTATLQESYPGLHSTFATNDLPTAEAVLDKDPNASVAFFPFDFWPCVKLWYQKFNPDVVISLRKMWIPNIVWGAHLWGASVCAIGVPARKFKPARAKLWTAINRWTLRGYDAMGFLNKQEKLAHSPLFEQNADVRVTGPTRFLQPRTNVLPSSQLKQWFQQNNPHNLPVIVGGSLHDDDMKLILEAFQAVCAKRSCLLLVAPRDLRNMENVEQSLRQRKISYSQRSLHKPSDAPDPLPEVLLLDTMGELSSAYHFAKAAYVGGTISGAGHNIYEPLEWEVPVFFGNGNGRTHASHQPAIEAGVGFRVHSSQELSEHWIRILTSPEYRQSLQERCKAFIADQQDAFEKNLQLLVDMIEHSPRRAR